MVPATYGFASSYCVDPIEEKLLRSLPLGSPALSFSVAG